MSKFWENLERAVLLYALGQNPMAMCYMNADEIRAIIYGDKK